MVTALLVGRRARRLDVTTPILFVRDGTEAQSWAVKPVLDHQVIARCQFLKLRSVKRYLSDNVPKVVERQLRAP